MPPDHDTHPPSPAPGLLQPIRAWLILAVAVQVASSILVLVPLIGLAELARTLLGDGPARAEAAWRIILVSGLCLSGGLALRGLVELITHFADNALGLRIRRQLAARIARAPLSWFTNQTGGRIKQGLQDDVSAIHYLVAHAFVDLANAITTPLVVYAYLFRLDWRMALVTLLPLPVFALLYGRIIAAADTSRMAQYGAALAKVNQAIVEFAQGIAIVKAFGQQGRAGQGYRRAVDEFRTFFLAWARPLVRPETLAALSIAPVTLLLLVLTCAVGFADRGWIAGADVLPFALLGLGISVPVTKLVSSAQAFQLARGASERLNALMAIPQERRPEGGARPDGGTDIRAFNTDSLMRLIAPVFQDTFLFSGTLRENLLLGDPSATDEDLKRAAALSGLDEVVARLPAGWNSQVGERGSLLSGGERQRVCIGRALLKRAPILLLDEVSSALDGETQAIVVAGLRALHGRATLLVISHQLSTIREADNILVLDAGRIVEQGTHPQLLAAGGRYAAFWQARSLAEGWRLTASPAAPEL